MTEGWVFDLYPDDRGQMIIWLITASGEPVRLVDKWETSVYADADQVKLDKLQRLGQQSHSCVSIDFDYKFRRLADFDRSRVLKLTFTSFLDASKFVKKVSRSDPTGYEFFNAEIPPAQSYLYHHDLFPTAYVAIANREAPIRWKLKDSADSVDYKIPPLRLMRLEVKAAVKGRLASFRDPVLKIVLQTSDDSVLIDSGSEIEKLRRMIQVVKELDPDVILTTNGGSFLFPYLAKRAAANGILPELVLGREETPQKVLTRDGKVYFSYGRIFYRPTPSRLFGRLHIDSENDFLFADCGLEGLIEIARTCRTPLYRASRETIGTNLTSLQLYYAYRSDILIPWRKNDPENFKSAWELFQADRGGFIFEPKLGVYDEIGELDFASLYPTLMMKHNLTPECISCHCCADTGQQVPGVNYTLCQNRVGIIPRTLRILLQKRAAYKARVNKTTDPELRKTFDERQSALKWSLVCSFGYLGYKNARFGKIDAHIAVCAFARDVLAKTAKISREMGFDPVHGIVDSVWVHKAHANEDDYLALRARIERELDLPISFEGRYRWIAFLPSRVRRHVPVLNRYYGVFEDGKIKVRGIETRRHDTPLIIKMAQEEVLRFLATAHNVAELRALVPQALRIVERYVLALQARKVDFRQLAIEKQLSKYPHEYVNSVLQAVAAKHLLDAGWNVSAGQTVRYVIVQAPAGNQRMRALPIELASEASFDYDAQEYVRLLLSAVGTMLSPFGYDAQRLEAWSNHRIAVPT